MLSDHAWQLEYTPEDGDLVKLFYIPALEDAGSATGNIEPPGDRDWFAVELEAGPNGQVPTMAGDVIVRVPATNHDDIELRRTMGRGIGRIVHETMDYERAARRAEIERRVRGWLGAGLQVGGPEP